MQKTKYLSGLLTILLFFSKIAIAQPPQYATPIGGTNFCFPFGSSATYYKCQFLYFPSDFSTPMVTGNITKIYINTNSTLDGTSLMTNLTIKMGMTASTALTTTYVTPLTTVFTAASFTFPAAAIGSWIPITLTTPFPYTAGSNFIVEYEISARAGATLCLSRRTLSLPISTPRIAYGPYAAVTAGGTFIDYVPDFGADILTGPPCPAPTGLNATNILSSSATVSWNAAASSTGYQYLVDQTSGNPTTAGTPIAGTTTGVSGLTPGGTYYLHVRNMCSPTNPSPWVNYTFNTLPPCNNPTGFNTTNLFETSTTINWAPLASAISWDYIVDQTYGTPSSSTGATNVTSPTDNLTGLMGNTKYYVHIRANCTGEQSGWSLDSFTTPLVCNTPVIKIDHINTNEAVAYWDKVPTAYQYEYALTQSATPPLSGTEIVSTGIHLPALNDGRKYYIHVRSHCNSLGSLSESAWAFADFSTFALSIDNTSKDGFKLSVYPNPANNVLNIEIKGALSDQAAYTITDPYGRIVKQSSLTSAKTEINTSALAAGIYMLKYTDGQHDSNIKITKE